MAYGDNVYPESEGWLFTDANEPYRAPQGTFQNMLNAASQGGGDVVGTYNKFGGYAPQANNWWEVPGLSDVSGFNMPDWAGADGGFGLTDSQSFYDYYQGLGPFGDDTTRNTFVTGAQSRYTSYQSNQASLNAALDELDQGKDFYMDAYGDWQANPDRAASLDWLRSVGDQLSEGYATWQNDPNRLAILEQLLNQSGQDYNAISDVETAAMQSQLAQAAAQQRAVIAGGQAGRGVAGGGHEGRVMGGVMNEANAAAQMINANVLGENQAARDRNLGQYASTTGMFNQLDQAYLSSMAGVGGMYGDLTLGGERVDQGYLDGILRAASAKAGIAGSAQYMPTDFAAYQNLADAREAAAREQAFMEEKLAFDQEQSEWGIRDWLGLLGALPGTGIPGMAMSFASNLFRGGE